MSYSGHPLDEYYEDVDDEIGEVYGDGDCPACYEGDLIEIRDVDNKGYEFTKLFCRQCGYEE